MKWVEKINAAKNLRLLRRVEGRMGWRWPFLNLGEPTLELCLYMNPWEQHVWFHRSSFDVSVHAFLPILLNLLVEKASSYVGYNLYYFHRSLMEPWASKSFPLGLCSPTFLSLQSSSNSPFIPFLPHRCEEHKNSENCERPSSTTSPAFHPKYISTLTAEMSKYSFTICPLLRCKVSNCAWTSTHIPHRPRCPSR